VVIGKFEKGAFVLVLGAVDVKGTAQQGIDLAQWAFAYALEGRYGAKKGAKQGGRQLFRPDTIGPMGENGNRILFQFFVRKQSEPEAMVQAGGSARSRRMIDVAEELLVQFGSGVAT